MEQKYKTFNDIVKGEEFNLTELFQIFKSALKSQRKYLIILFIIFLSASTINFYLQLVEYKSEATVLIDQNGSNSNTGSIAGLLGINSSNSGLLNDNLFGPDMYQEIVKSDAFLNELALTTFHFKKNNKKSISLWEYINFYTKKNFFEKTILRKKNDLNNLVEKNNQLDLNDTEVYWEKTYNNFDSTNYLYFSNKVPPIVKVPVEIIIASNYLKENIKIDIKGKKLTVSVIMPDEKLSANLCKLVLEKIINYVYIYKTNRQRENIYYLEKNFNQAKDKYTKAQLSLAEFKDKNIGLIFQTSQNRELILNNELSLAFNLYNQFAIQLEQAKFDYKKEQPLFIVTDPIKLLGKNNVSFFIMFLKYLIVYVFIAIITIVYKIIFSK
jgi:hypothetical protein